MNHYPHCSNRLYEWIMAAIMVGLASSLAAPGPTMVGPFTFLLDTGVVTENWLAFFFFVVGTVRMVFLWLNGKTPIYGPVFRSIGCFMGALVWFQMTAIVAYVALMTGQVSTALPVYGFLTLGELISSYRATYDAGRTS